MIVIQSGMQQDEIIGLFDKKIHEDISFVFIEKKGISLKFSVSINDQKKIVKLVKKIILSKDWGRVLYFNVFYE